MTMQDRFKFRYIYNGKLYDVLSIDFRRKNIDLKKDEMTLIHLESELNDKNLIQCTGLKDKNGKLIYEGDIVTDGYDNNFVEWDETYCQFLVIEQSTNGIKTVYTFENLLSIEVIGNIYENEELLKQ